MQLLSRVYVSVYRAVNCSELIIAQWYIYSDIVNLDNWIGEAALTIPIVSVGG